MDQQVIWGLFSEYLEATDLLEIEDDFTNRAEAAHDKLAALQIGSDDRY